MKKIDIIEKNEDESMKSQEIKKLNIRKITINIGIVSITLLLILFVPKSLLDLMPALLGNIGFILLVTLIFSAGMLIVNLFNKKLKIEKVEQYKFQKKFYGFYDYFAYFINTIAIIYAFMICFATPSTVDGRSMENTLHHKDSVLVYHFLYNPKKGDIVVINANPYKTNWYPFYEENSSKMEDYETEYYVKKCQAIQGDKIEFIENAGGYIVRVNDTNINNLIISRQERDILLSKNNIEIENNIIQSDHILVISDNRDIATVDSREMGFIQKKDVIGKVTLRFFPFSDFKFF